MHKHPTLAHVVADHRREALLADASAQSWAITPADRTRRWQRQRRLLHLVDNLTDILSRIVEDFEPTPSPSAPTARRVGP